MAESDAGTKSVPLPHSACSGEDNAPALAKSEGADALIMRQKEPECLESPFSLLDNVITPDKRFYVRNHFPVPAIDPGSYRLRIEGAVETPLELTLEDLRAMTGRTVLASLECGGNGRRFLNPAVHGVPWESGAISAAEWTGVPLATLLEKAGVRPDTVEIVLEGADGGDIKNPHSPVGTVRFARSLPLTKAQNPYTLLAYHMNGKDLPPAQGFPLRAVVPGWYAVASIKWLTRIVAVNRPFQGFYQTVDYAYWEMRDNLPNRIPLGEMRVKAMIARPAPQESVPCDVPCRIFGAAWTGGDAQIHRVEISADGGATWEAAHLLGKSQPYVWRLWEKIWLPPRPGRYSLMARATDTQGRVQPMERDALLENYMIHHVIPVEIEAV